MIFACAALLCDDAASAATAAAAAAAAGEHCNQNNPFRRHGGRDGERGHTQAVRVRRTQIRCGPGARLQL